MLVAYRHKHKSLRESFRSTVSSQVTTMCKKQRLKNWMVDFWLIGLTVSQNHLVINYTLQSALYLPTSEFCQHGNTTQRGQIGLLLA